MVPLVRHRRHLAFGALASALALSAVSLPPVVSPVAVAPAVADPAKKVDLSPRADSISAMIAAQSAGKRVEDLSQGDAFTQVFANPDGTWTTESASEPVRAQDEKGTWAPLDLTLVKVGGRLVPKDAPGEVSLSAGGDRVFADAVPEDGPGGAGKISWGWPSELPEPVLDGPTATYEDVIAGGGDLVVTATASGFTHNVVLDERPKEGADGKVAPFELTVPVTAPGAEVRTNPAGGVEVVAKAKGHEVVAAAPRPVMWDSSAPGPQAGDDAAAASGDPAVAPVKASVVDTAGGGRLVLEPDMDFLTDPATVYPVTVDPQFTLYSNADTWVMNTGFTSGQGSSSILRAGTQDGGASLARSFMKFPGEATWNGTQIRGAVLKLWNSQSGSCNAGAIRASRITASWAPSTLTWSNQPAATATDQAQYSPAHGATGCAAAEAQWNVTNIVQGWASGSTANYGLRLAAYTETNSNTWRTYWSADSAGGVQKPRLVVTYNRYPSTPTALQVAPSPDGSHVASTTPTLSAVVTDPDGGQVAGYFEVKQGSTVVWSGTSAAVASGGTASVEVPSGKLTDGGQYTVTVRGQDTVAARSVSAASTNITVDANVPDVIVTSNVFTNGTWTNTLPGSATTTLNGSADTTAFLLDYDGVKANIKANSSGDATMPYTPTAGWHVLDVTPIDAAGNYGPKVTFAHGAGSAAFTTPTQWTPSTGSFPIDFSSRPTAAGATLQWRLAGQSTWRAASKLEKVDGASWTGAVTTSGGRSTTGSLVWNATDEMDGTSPLISAPSLLEVRGCFQYTGTSDSCSAATYLGLFQSAFGGRFPTTELGPAEVALLNGEAMISDADAADSQAGVGRTFASLSDDSLGAGAFGPGWSEPQIPGSAEIIDNRAKDGTLIVVDVDGSSQSFAPQGSGVFKPVEPTGDATELVLTAGSPDTLALKRPRGAGKVVTTWEWKASDTGKAPGWAFKEIDAPFDGGDVYVTNAGRLPTFIRQSAAVAATACNADSQTEGCRALKITYTGTGASTRVSAIDRVIGSSAAAGVSTKRLADYTYESGKLTKVCGPDPDGPGEAMSLCTEYTYTTVAGRTMIATLKPAGLKEWRFAYDGIGRLLNVKRERPATSGGGDATWSIDYDLSPSSGGLPDMTAAKIAEWGQQVAPTKVYAVYEPYVGSADVTKADLVYTDNGGVTTNSATYGPDGWLVNTNWYDARGNTVQQLNATGWARAQAAPVGDRPRIASEGSSYTVYNNWGDGDTVGTRVVDEYSAAHTAALESGVIGYYRSHTAYVYDDDPSVDPALVADRPGTKGLGLVVKSTDNTTSADRAQSFDEKVTTYGFAPVVAGDANGWNLGVATTSSQRVSGSTWVTSTTRYGTNGEVVESREPGGSANADGVGNDAHSTVVQHYTASGSGDCGGKPAWAGLICKSGPAAPPSGTSVPTHHYTAFDDNLNPTSVELVSGGSVKETLAASYDGLGRIATSTVATSGAGVTTDSITTAYSYDSMTGQPSTISSGSSTITNTFDSWGRRVSYTDANGNASNFTYDAVGRRATGSTGSTATAFNYDAHGYLTSAVVDGGVGAFSYSYRADGSLSQVEYPNGLTARFAGDEVGTTVGLTYSTGMDPILTFGAVRDSAGRVLEQTSAASAQSFDYDLIGRLSSVEDTRGGTCVTRNYSFNASSERTLLESFDASPTGTCQRTTSSSTEASTYDTAGRSTNSGYSYDLLGRTQTIPVQDTATVGTGPLTISYRANDMVASMVQDVPTGTSVESRLVSYGHDPASRVSSVTNKTNAVETSRLRYLYGDESDRPVAIKRSIDSGATWSETSYVTVPELGLAAEKTGNTVTYQLANMHGDIVASADAAAAVSGYTELDEFGNGESTDRRYGWHGTQQRSNDTLGGMLLMGARLYNPATGRFTTTDPVPGGNTTRFGYPADPVNGQDISGCRECRKGQNWRARDPRFDPSPYYAEWNPAAKSLYKWVNRLQDIMDWIDWAPGVKAEVVAARWRHETTWAKDQVCRDGVRWYVYITARYRAVQGKIKVTAGIGPLRKKIWQGWVGSPVGDSRVSYDEIWRRN